MIIIHVDNNDEHLCGGGENKLLFPSMKVLEGDIMQGTQPDWKGKVVREGFYCCGKQAKVRELLLNHDD